MFAGDAIKSVIALGLQPDESAAALGTRFEAMLMELPDDAQFIILADIIGGSPLTTVCNVLSKQGKLRDSLITGGMNFPMALTAMMSKDVMTSTDLKVKILSDATGAIRFFDTSTSSELSDDDI
ncbi:phosphotransferase system, mannose fructose-specific component IIA [Loigolactobacillus coryniformis subsp. coryniformis KCTC 3167 = DSM 20001]|nr:phosphotransferase system, mannose fructose-specific component IIA [Loigolactobacillus coryniformis subsp. coryniformis KCTC 3167 = DSM 20001]